MHDITNPLADQALRDALHEEVADLEPCNCLAVILDRATPHIKRGLWIAGLIGGLLVAVGAALMLAHNLTHNTGPQPAAPAFLEA